MAYSKTTWVDRLVAFPRRFDKTLETSGSVTLTPNPGAITTAGTLVAAATMNNIEQGIADAHFLAGTVLNIYSTAGGSSNIFTVAGDPGITVLTDGLVVNVKMHASNAAGVISFNLNGLGVKTVYTPTDGNWAQTKLGDFKTGFVYTLRYSTNLGGWVVQGAMYAYSDNQNATTLTVGSGKQYATINAALLAVKKVNAGAVTISIDPGTYNETLFLSGYHGAAITLQASSGTTANILVNAAVSVQDCSAQISLNNIKIAAAAAGGFYVQRSLFVYLSVCEKTIADTSTGRGILADRVTFMRVDNCLFSNNAIAFDVYNSRLHLTGITGSANGSGIVAQDGSQVTKGTGYTMTATTAQTVTSGSNVVT